MAMFSIAPVTPEELECKAEAARSLKERYDQILEEMNGLFHAFDRPFRGEQEYWDALVACFDRRHDTCTSLSHLLESYANMMDTSAKTLREMKEMEKSGRPDLFGSIHD